MQRAMGYERCGGGLSLVEQHKLSDSFGAVDETLDGLRELGGALDGDVSRKQVERGIAVSGGREKYDFEAGVGGLG